MKILVVTISIILYVTLFLLPPAIFYRINKKNVKFIFWKYLIISLISTAIFITLYAWWTDFSNDLLLSNYGYNKDGMNDLGTYGGVAPENLEEVKRIEERNFGIGWPLKAILSFPFFTIYLFVIYLIGYGYKKYKTLNTQ